jgi:hypothetical protein
MLTPNKVLAILGTLVTGLLGVLGFVMVRYIDNYIPIKIESEIRKNLQEQTKAQIAEEIKTSFAIQIQNTKDDWGKKIEENSREINKRIDGIYELLTQPPTFPRSLKGAVRKQNHATLMKTLPVIRDLLVRAKAKALSEPEVAPILRHAELVEITNDLFTKYKNSDLSSEVWDTLLELASYKTVINGIEFGMPSSSKDYNDVISLNDQKLSNEVIINKVVSFGNCPVTLRNVRFVNSKFEIERGTNGEQLLKTLLRSDKPGISLRLAGPPGYTNGACGK